MAHPTHGCVAVVSALLLLAGAAIAADPPAGQTYLICLDRQESAGSRPMPGEAVDPALDRSARRIRRDSLERLERLAVQIGGRRAHRPNHLMPLQLFSSDDIPSSKVQGRLWVADTLVMQLTPGEAAQVRDHPEVDWVYPDRFMRISLGKTSAPKEEANWYQQRTGIHEMRATHDFSGRGVRVGVIDTGLEAGSSIGTRVTAYRDFTTQPVEGMSDPEGHGTSITELIAGSRNGIAPSAQVTVARVIEQIDLGSTPEERKTQVGAFASRILLSLNWMADQQMSDTTRIDILNGSWGFPEDVDLPPGIFRETLSRIRAMGAIPVFAAGNGPVTRPGHVQIPASYPEVIAVGATTAGSARAPFSALGTGPDTSVIKPDIMAPGVPIPGGAGIQFEGTSYASAIVSGALALVKQGHPQASADEVVAAMRDSAQDLGMIGPDSEMGYGEIRAQGIFAVLGGQPPLMAPPIVAARTVEETTVTALTARESLPERSSLRVLAGAEHRSPARSTE